MPSFNEHKKNLVKAVEDVIKDYVKDGHTSFERVEMISYAGRELKRFDPKLEITCKWLARD